MEEDGKAYFERRDIEVEVGREDAIAHNSIVSGRKRRRRRHQSMFWYGTQRGGGERWMK